MKVKFIDFSREYNILREKLERKIALVLEKGNFILGDELKKFEQEFAQYCGVKFALGVNSGTDALFLALLSLGIGEGDEVIIPSFTYVATALAVTYTKARPVFCDIEEKTYGMDIDDLATKITSKTRVIIPVHLYGHPVRMREILKIAKKHNLKIVEDCAQAHGAKLQTGNYRWQVVGSIGDLGCFSFYPTKNLGCYGDGGMIVTNSKKLYQKILMLRDYGRESKYRHRIIGYNSRLDTLQAAILRIKLKYLDRWNEKRRQLAHYYNKLLEGIEGVILPQEENNYEHVYHIYVLRVKKKRDFLYKELSKKNISTLIHYPLPCHLQPCYQNLGYKKGDLPVSEKISQEVISLPLYPFLQRKEIEYIAKAIKEIL